MLVGGNAALFQSPQDSRRAGIGMVHQHFTLVPKMSVRDNLLLSELDGLGGTLDEEALLQAPKQVAEKLGWEIPWKEAAGTLSVGIQQRIEVLKVLSLDPSIVIFDEPTASLSPGEVESLFEKIRELAGTGKTVILIAHKLSEVFSVADRISVLRRGEWIGTQNRDKITPDEVALMMLGEAPTRISEQELTSGPALIMCERIVVDHGGLRKVDEVSINIHEGEIVGIGGVDGNGQVEFAEFLAGVRKSSSGVVTTELDPRLVGYVPQSRSTEGLALTMSIEENCLVGCERDEPPYAKGILRTQPWKTGVSELLKDFDVRLGGASDRAETLSGGNQQKVILGRVLRRNPKLLIVHNPTRGLDFHAVGAIHRKLREAAARGCAVVLFSTDKDELDEVATRQLFMGRGRLFQTEAEALQ